LDVAALIPAEPIIVTKGQNQFTLGGQVTISLETAWNLASLSSTLMHEIKHAIDQNSHAAVEGAAWEGAATSIERQVWPIFIEEAMAGQTALLPVARLKTEIDNVRFTATTDATLKIFLRESCKRQAYAVLKIREEISVHCEAVVIFQILPATMNRTPSPTPRRSFEATDTATRPSCDCGRGALTAVAFYVSGLRCRARPRAKCLGNYFAARGAAFDPWENILLAAVVSGSWDIAAVRAALVRTHCREHGP
jgi:hypothetical protein